MLCLGRIEHDHSNIRIICMCYCHSRCFFCFCGIASEANKWKIMIFEKNRVTLPRLFRLVAAVVCALAKYQKHVIYSFYYFECTKNSFLWGRVSCSTVSTLQQLSYMILIATAESIFFFNFLFWLLISGATSFNPSLSLSVELYVKNE